MVMAPAESPAGLNLFPHKNLRVMRINKRALALVFAIIVVLVAILIVSIWGRGKSLASTEGGVSPKAEKAQSAQPPAELMAANPGRGIKGKPETKDAPVMDLQKEQAEFGREIRRFAHQRYMQRLSRADLALLAEVGVNGSESPDKAAPSDRPAGVGGQRLAEGDSFQAASGGVESYASNNDPNLQARKENFAERDIAGGRYLPYRKEAPISANEIKQGTVIPAIMISGINSDLPGQIMAQVSQNVFDTVSGRKLLIPQGTRLVGSYDSFVAIGQERALVAWRRLIFPDGKSLELLNMGGADQGGYAGFNDQVNNHYTKIFGSAMLLSLVGAGYQLSQPQPRVGEALSSRDIVAAQMGQQLSQVSSEMMRRNMQIQPTIEIRPGYRFNVMVNHDMILEPYGEEEE